MLARLVEFVSFIDESGVALNTRQAYERDIKLLNGWLVSQNKSVLADISGADLMEYVDLLTKEGKSASTISRSIASMRKFFAFTNSRGYTYDDPSVVLKAPKVIKKAPVVVGDKDVRKLLNAPDVETPKGIRDKAMLELIMATGMTVSEIIDLKISDIDFRTYKVNVEGKKRSISIGRKTTDYLRDYSKIREKFIGDSEDAGTYFVSCAGDKMTRQGFWKIIRTCGKSVGIDEITPQMLRHSFAVSALKHGKDAATLQQMLGHSSRAGSLEYQNMVKA